MRIIVDTHVHLYPCYDLRIAMVNLFGNLSGFGGDAQKAAFLAERYDCDYFNRIKNNGQQILGNKFKVEVAGEENALVISADDGDQLYLYAGRQIVSRERIEILALATDFVTTAEWDARKVVEHVIEKGGIPVISWAPGKWFFKRKKVVQDLIDQFNPGEILIGDTTLRPHIWKEPDLMYSASQKGFSIVAGSDPLPFEGEEKYLGCFGSLIEGEISDNEPVSSIRSILKTPGKTFNRVGRRNRTAETIMRLVGNAQSKRK
jgi:hypothetical protein